QADTLRRTSVHLTLDQQRIDGAADILDDDVTSDAHLARFRVNCHLREMGAEAWRLLGDGRAALADNWRMAATEVGRLLDHIGDGDAARRRAPDRHPPVPDLQVGGI